MPALCPQLVWIEHDRINAITTGICIVLALAVPITSSVVSATRLLSSRRENATPAEKNRRRMLILQWHTLLIATLAYTIPTIVELFSHPGFTVDDSRNEDYETQDRGYPTFACRELRPTGWSPPAFTEVFWLINLLAADASLLYLANRSRGFVPKYLMKAVNGYFVFSAVLLLFDTFTPRLFLTLAELNCALILLARFVADKLAARKGKSPETLRESQPVSLPILLVVVGYMVTKIVYIPVMVVFGGSAIWGNPMVFLSAAVLQHVYIGSAADDEEFMSGSGYIALPVEDIPHTPTPEMAV